MSEQLEKQVIGGNEKKIRPPTSREIDNALREQPTPKNTNQSAVIFNLLKQRYAKNPLMMDICERRMRQGIAKYKVPLSTNNGRDVSADVLQEAVDGLFYATQGVQEAGSREEQENWQILQESFGSLILFMATHIIKREE